MLAAKASKDGERFDRAQWKSMASTMNDSTKFVDMMHNVSWQDGLPSDVLQGKEWTDEASHNELHRLQL